MDIGISNYWLHLIIKKKILGLLPSNWVLMTPAWHWKTILGPSLLFKGQLPMYDFIRCSYPVFAACFSGRSKKKKKNAAVHFLWLTKYKYQLSQYQNIFTTALYQNMTSFVFLSWKKSMGRKQCHYFSQYIFSTSHNRCIFLLSNNLSLILSYI